MFRAVLGDEPEQALDDSMSALTLLHSLDGERLFELRISRGADDLLIAGGKDGWYQVLMSLDDVTTQFDARGRHGETGRVTMITGGQRVNPKLETCVTRIEAEAVIESFLLDGSRSPVVVWRKVF